MWYIQLSVIALLLVEARWRFAWLRLALVALLVFELRSVTLGPAYRRAIAQAQELGTPTPPAEPPTLTSEYKRGVLNMREEARSGLDRQLVFPTYALAWLAISPLLLDRLSALRQAWKRRKRSNGPPPSGVS